ncbi:MAG: class D sortase [Clostridia bacterium]|nr:class D sortase [Clostridia bacterium]
MNCNVKRILVLATTIIVLIGILIGSFFIIKNEKEKAENRRIVNSVVEVYNPDDVQERLENEENKISDDLLVQIDGETVIGVIKINKIDFEGLVYEGTSLDTLAKGVGHFESTSFFDGNVGLAAHNSDKYWAKLHTLEVGDEITYVSFLGTRNYKVSSIEKISETDWSKLSNTNSNILTLLTCVKDKPAQRLCVQAIETN